MIAQGVVTNAITVIISWKAITSYTVALDVAVHG